MMHHTAQHSRDRKPLLRWAWQALGLALTCAFVGLGVAQLAAGQARTVAGPVTRFVDGDTFWIGGVEVRPWGIDTPERGRRCTTTAGATVDAYQFANITLIQLVGDRPLTCDVKYIERNKERAASVAVCRVVGLELNKALVERGVAWDWPKYSGGVYADAERDARQRRVGFWGMTCPNLNSGRKLK